jgi:hydrogenase 3 maturation protease
MIVMSKPSWRISLIQTLKRNKASDSVPRVAVVGVGHELCGDDAAGLAAARALQTALADDERFLVIEAGPTPENQTGLLRRFKPDLVLLIDAAQMGETPGVIRWLPWDETDGISASTHTLPFHILARYLVSELGCEVALLCIQPARNTVGAPLSPKVAEAVHTIVDALVGNQDTANTKRKDHVGGIRKAIGGCDERRDSQFHPFQAH